MGWIPGLGRGFGEGYGEPLYILPWKIHGQRNLVACGAWDLKGSDKTE